MRTIKYYYKLDKDKSRQMMIAICAECEVSPSTAYKWMNGTRKPGAQDQKFLQRLIKKFHEVSVPREELFA